MPVITSRRAVIHAFLSFRINCLSGFPQLIHRGFRRLPRKTRGCYTFAASRSGFRSRTCIETIRSGVSATIRVPRAEFCSCQPQRRIAGSGLSDGRCGAGGADVSADGPVSVIGGAFRWYQYGVGERPGRDDRAGRWSGDGTVGTVSFDVGYRPEVVGGHHDIRDCIGCLAHGAAPAHRRARGRFDRASIDFELLCQGKT
jgi:hypothetical protein